MDSNVSLRVPAETVVQDPRVVEVDDAARVHLEPVLSAQEQMTRQISQLWDAHTNFQGLDLEDPETTEPSTQLDATAVRAKVHEQLLLAQSEIQVSLDVVRLLVAAKKKQALLESPEEEVTVGGLPFPVGVLDATRIDTQRAREDELRFVLGAKYSQLGEAADTLESSMRRLKEVAQRESVFWRTAFELRRRNWLVQQRYGYFIRYGYSDAGSAFDEDSVAELRRTQDDATDPLYIPRTDHRHIQVRLSTQDNEAPRFASNEFATSGSTMPYDLLHLRLLEARRSAFDRELYHRLCQEARALELGSVRASPGASDVRDTLATTLSRDDMAVRLEWVLEDREPHAEHAVVSFAEWQRALYAGLALVMAAMHQRRLHRHAKDQAVGRVLEDSSPHLVLAPVLQSVQFARWQNVIAATTRHACAAWRRLVDEPLEVVSHFARIYQADLRCSGMAFVARMRFRGGTVMAFRLDDRGSLVFAKGYFPPPTERGSIQWPEQMLIHRVFRIVPLASLSEFIDQLRRELQSLVLLRVAHALSRRSYPRDGKRCQMGRWYVHQSQQCVVGELWEGARHRQIVGVAKWSDWALTLYFGPKHPTVFDKTHAPGVPWVASYPVNVDAKTFEQKLFMALVAAF
ncbi:subunit 17 of mediator complex-domain-containing protein [Coemansia spiralis]|nr:subunit 17 of mediator complex-domain-containing protein [Coemansia spiralis]